MSFGEDDEILQDFLVEAGEILDLLSEQLIELEQRPDDRNLLNAIFRGFHTVKGGAGFLQLEAMVECCHATESLFDMLRNGKRKVTPALMDVVLQALDTINAQFRQISQREKPTRAAPALMASLEALVSGEEPGGSISGQAQTASPSAATTDPDLPPEGLDLTDEEFEGFLEVISESTKDSATPPPEAPAATPPASDEISEDEFEALLDRLHGAGKRPGASAASTPEAPKTTGADEIGEDEFEALLDQLHGIGKGPVGTAATPGDDSEPAAESPPDLITDREFEELLDQLHGRGKGPTAISSSTTTPSTTTPSTTTPPTTTRLGKASATASGKVDEAPMAPADPHQEAAHSSAPKPRNADIPAPTAAPATNQVETTVRVDTQRLDDIMNMVGELVLVRNRLVRLGLDTADEAFSKAVANLDVVTADLQTAVMKTRMQPIKKVFGRFPRVVRDMARNLKKEIHLELVGEDTDLDKNLVEALADPLVHLVRNAVDHGIELPSVREGLGKSRTGRMVLSAVQEGDHILLSISDDGAGMDPEKLREKAVEKGILEADSAARLSDADAFDLIFAPGFSTKAEISDVSGRGVGMDVVKTKISQLNGSIEIQSKHGEGTRLNIKVPLTLAIMPTLMIMLERQAFALPLVNVNEIFQMDLTKSHVVDGQECVTIRDKAIPIFHLKRWLVRGYHNSQKIPGAHVVIVTVGTRRVGFVVDQLIGQEEVVIKPLGRMLQGTPGIAGATITGDGTIALILDVPSLLKRYVGGI